MYLHKFCLYTYNAGPIEMFTDNVTSMTNSYFDPCAETIFIITGLNQEEDEPELIKASKSIAEKFYNVIVVNFYTKSYVSEVKRTARKIANFIESLEYNTGADSNHISLLGISLGAQIAGAVGKLRKTGRIIALDPSGPVYDLLSPKWRLDSTDAEFVDVVHSSQVYGTRKYMGHVNFIVNGGRSQPKCSPFDFHCHHVRAAYVFLATVTNCDIYFRQCFAYWAFKAGLCNSWPRLKIGLDINIRIAKRRGGRYYYDTSTDDFPFCAEEEQKTPKLHPLFC